MTDTYKPSARSVHSLATRDPEDRPACDERQVREKMLDKTVADSFPASDPPSSLPDPDEDSFGEAA